MSNIEIWDAFYEDNTITRSKQI